jgi:cysteine-rich repeat protein
MGRFWWVVLVGMAACIRPDLVACDDGTSCPYGDVCDTVHDSCAAPDQLTACAGVADETACTTAELTGVCLGGVCLTPGCGNGVVEPGEVCEPPDPGHGCSADCKSNETCGNGVVDAITGEACDDGNLRNHDGCDSRCRSEQLAFDLQPYVPMMVTAVRGVMDEAHDVLVHYDQVGSTWGWDGTQWSLLARGGPVVYSAAALVYDTDLQRPVVIGTSGNVVADWDGDTWTLHTVTGAPTFEALGAFYDGAAHAVAMFDTSDHVWELSLGSATWAQVATVPAGETMIGAVFDRARAVAVVVMSDAVYEWTALQGWSAIPSSAPPAPITTAINLVYDVDRAHVVAWGGCGSANCTGAGYAWDGSAWNALAATGAPAASGDELGYDPVAHRTVIVIGQSTFDTSLATGAITTLDAAAAAWAAGPLTPRVQVAMGIVSPSGATAKGREVYATSVPVSATWMWDGTWSQVSSTPPINLAALTYDAGRDQLVGVVGSATWTFDTSWHDNAFLGLPQGGAPTSVVYDPVRHGSVIVSAAMSSTTWLLADAATAWTDIAGAPSINTLEATLSFDASCGCVVWVEPGVGTFASTQASELDAGGWQAAAAPGGSYQYVSSTWSARESVLLLPLTSVGILQPVLGSVWERRGDSLTRGPVLPVELTGVAFDDPKRGAVITIGTLDGFTGELVTSYRGVGGEELCDGTDGDGDGLVGCADPDCWWTCTPTCPPGTSC